MGLGMSINCQYCTLLCQCVPSKSSLIHPCLINGSIISLSVSIGLPSHPKIHHLNSYPGGTILSLSKSDNAIMTAFYPGMEIIHWMSLLSVKAFITTV